ncbi:Interstitial collagenase [Camponotus floridanus]|uniref:Interstitial collagenase n=1 Tax=Camponotus floridanus TaxID=104421 RepID=E1ZZH8_CAMFO|nr:Interstitial collagenase [Camponotus floridanus]
MNGILNIGGEPVFDDPTIVRDAIYRASRDFESNAAVTIYVKGREKKKWLTDIAGEVTEQRDLTIETIDADYEDIGLLRTLASTLVYRCGYHAKNCVLENVCKLHNWWLERRDQLCDMNTTGSLPGNGVLTVEMIRVMRRPRCGVADIHAYSPLTRKWPTTHLTWNFKLANRDTLRTTQSAFALWSEQSSLTF